MAGGAGRRIEPGRLKPRQEGDSCSRACPSGWADRPFDMMSAVVILLSAVEAERWIVVSQGVV